MRVIVNDKMKEWTAAYIRSHRIVGRISIHVVFSKFNEDFRATFKIDPQVAVNLMMKNGFLKGRPAKSGFSIWLPEDEGQGCGRPFLSRKSISGTSVSQMNQIQPEALVEQTGDVEMAKSKLDEVVIDPKYHYETIPHPVTGEVGVLNVVRHIMAKIEEALPKDVPMDGGYAVAKISITGVMKGCGIEEGQRPEFSRILQEMALIKCYTSGGNSRLWGVLHIRAVEYFITSRAYLAARNALEERRARNSEIIRLRETVAKQTDLTKLQQKSIDDLKAEVAALNAQAPQSVEIVSDGPTLEQLAQAVVVANDNAAQRDAALAEVGMLRALVEDLQRDAAGLKQKLEDKRSAKQVADELMASLRK